jgi:3-oxoacyl-[acyl-carrier protein] reductase
MPNESTSQERPVALVTGGSRGIGAAVCAALAADGMDIVVNYAGNEAAALHTVQTCEAQGVHALAVRADISDAAQVDALFAQALETFGHIDVLVNNAGITRDGLAVRMSEADFDAVIATNLRGAFLCMKAAGTLMMKARRGRIINISSVVGLHGNAGQINYAASKAGVIAATKSLAKELGGRGVTVNAVAPGFIETDMTAQLSEKTVDALKASIALKKFGQPADVAAVVSFLASDAAGYITGQVLGVDGGMGM